MAVVVDNVVFVLLALSPAKLLGNLDVFTQEQGKKCQKSVTNKQVPLVVRRSRQADECKRCNGLSKDRITVRQGAVKAQR